MISILTPAYNRAHTLTRLFESLRNQSDKRFEWIVVDDGSMDGTESLVASFDRIFPIRYVHQSNSGKHVAINHGVTLCQSGHVMIVDSDDALTPDAVREVNQAISLHPGYAGYGYRKAFMDGRLMGPELDESNESNGSNGSNGSNVPFNPTTAWRIIGEVAYVFAREALRANPFPVFSPEKFVPELYIWNRIADAGTIRYFPGKCIYLCEYQLEGYTRNFIENLRRNPSGFSLFYRNQARREPRLVNKLKCLLRLVQCAYFSFAAKRA